MNDLRTAAQAVVDAFADPNARANLRGHWLHLSDCITALKTALAQQEQEPCKRHNPCERLPDGYCARCHSEMYP